MTLTKEQYLNDKAPLCDYCGKPDDTVRECIDPFDLDVRGVEVFIKICNSCYLERRMDV